MKQIKRHFGPVVLVVIVFLSLYLAQCGSKSDKIMAAAAAGTSLEIRRASDSTFAVISRDIRNDTELIVKEDSLQALLAVKYRASLIFRNIKTPCD